MPSRLKFSIIITTKNRLKDLKITLSSIAHLLKQEHVECIICDDGSTDGTSNFIATQYPSIQLIKNSKSEGLIYSRNLLMSLVKSEFAISLDDDLNFITKYPLDIIEDYFKKNVKCGVISFRIFWDLSEPYATKTNQKPYRMKSYAGGAHAYRVGTWNSIPNYPNWFKFYGEEEFASYQLFKAGWEVHYVPDILVHHRVDIKGRKSHKDYRIRLRRSLRSGWYLYFLFYPLKTIPRRFLYTLWIQIKMKVLKGDFRALLAILQALGDLVINFPRLLKQANRLSNKEFLEYSKLADTKLYWTPED